MGDMSRRCKGWSDDETRMNELASDFAEGGIKHLRNDGTQGPDPRDHGCRNRSGGVWSRVIRSPTDELSSR